MSDAATTKPLGGLTARESEVALAALQCIKSGDIQIDYVALCSKTGLKNEASAKTAWCQVKRKLFGEVKASSTDEPSSTPKVKTPRKPKAAGTTTPNSSKRASKTEANGKAGDHDCGDGGSNGAASPAADGDVNGSQEAPNTPKTPTTPKKRGRKTKAEKEAEAAASGEAATVEGDEEEKPAKKRRTPAKKKAAESDNNAENEGEAKATPVKGKKAATPRKTAAAATDKATTPAGAGEGEVAIVEAAKVKKDEDPAVAVETTNGSVGDAADTAVEAIAAKATEVVADAAGDN